MPKLVAPLAREFKIRGVVGVEDNDPIVVRFKQAREKDVYTRQTMLAQRVERRWAPEDMESFAEIVDAINPSRRRAIEVWLTMLSCNVEEEAPNGSLRLMFPSVQLNGTEKLNVKDFDAFERKWGELDPEWALAIHTACILVNPTWGIAIYDDEQIEEVLTEGEGSGASE